ncbi:hypothetical protein NGRA_0330 [Nosema granulosis]|uniref:Glutaredoxin domain-containing protein n=1 Tax=Nosema granulosis TaxID=83296 RepID=A0A9P6H0J0_9MICR|nr:hypothetical protein NGRA_0330 [Nosema granulosis]
MIFLYILAILCDKILPKALQKNGIVIAGSKKCKFTKELVEWMDKNNKPYTMAYIDGDRELTNYMIDVFNGGIPVVFENGVSQGSGKEYMDKHNTKPGNQNAAVKVDKVGNMATKIGSNLKSFGEGDTWIDVSN